MTLLLVAQPRSGSTTLFRCCIEHPKVIGILEPFGSYIKTEFSRRLWRLSGRREWSQVLDDLDTYGNCFKTITKQMTPKLLQRWATRPGVRTVLLTRRNKLRQAVSLWISLRTNVWLSRPEDRAKIASFAYPLISRDAVAHTLNIYHHDLLHTRSVLERVQPLEVFYEDLFGQDFAAQLAIVEKVMAHGGFDPALLSPSHETLRRMLSPAAKYQNVVPTIPGIEAIEDAFAEAHGSLFG